MYKEYGVQVEVVKIETWWNFILFYALSFVEELLTDLLLLVCITPQAVDDFFGVSSTSAQLFPTS